MTTISDPHNPGLEAQARLHGYTVQKKGRVQGLDAVFYTLEHRLTGARHFHISRPDAENTFGVAFKTVPADSTGVAHILEHTVLCGSARYPVRDPFFSMLKRSLSTFMNAFTASDWTMYPFSTENAKDFYNLMAVYLDAAFFPVLDVLSFKQEGHRMELEPGPQGPDSEVLVYKGVVYNEMKGAMSSPDQVMVRSLMNALYPDTTYRNNSGGEPEDIPTLTHDQLRTFHRRHYHPSNAFFYTYGNLPLAEHLAFIQAQVLGSFDRIDPKTEVPSQPRWPHPKTVVYPYPFSGPEDPSKKYQACVAWLTADILDSFEVLVMTVLGQVLLGNAASPLRKALIDSDLGTALCDGTGYDSDNRDTLFAAGLKGVGAMDAEPVAAVVFEVLRSLVRDGIDRGLIDSAIHQLEFHRKEVTNTPYPYGIRLLLTFAGSWLHGADPERVLNFDADLDRLRRELAEGPFLEESIRRHLLENPHRVLFTLAPDTELAAARERETARELARIKAGLDESALAAIREDAEALARLQETQGDVSCLPTLGLSDIPPSVKTVVPASTPKDILCYAQPTAGIFYLSAAAGTAALDSGNVPLLPLFCNALPKVGTRLRDFTAMVRRIDAHTGGMGLAAHAGMGFGGNGDCVTFVNFNGKCLDRNQENMLGIAEELMTEVDFSDVGRLRQLLLEYRAALESAVVQNGHRLAMSLAARHFSTAAALGEQWHGVGQIRFIKALTEDLTEEKLRTLSQDLAAVGRSVFAPVNLKIALVGGREMVDQGAGRIHRDGPLSTLVLPGSASGAFAGPSVVLDETPPWEGWVTSASVSFSASVFETVRMAHDDAPALSAAAKLLRSLYLHREIREKGGAYGGFSLYNPETGLFSMASYRDPHIVSTLKVFEGAADFLKAGTYTDEDIKEAILQVCSEIDKPDPPGPAAKKAFYRSILSLTDEARARFKSRLLRVDRDQMAGVARRYFGADRKRGVAVISGRPQLEAANQRLGAEGLRLNEI